MLLVQRWKPFLGLVLLLFFNSILSAQPSFINPLPIPYLVNASDSVVTLEARQYVHAFNPGEPMDTTNRINAWSYNTPNAAHPMTILGPTIKWRYGDSVNLRVSNQLPQSITTHWHGAEVPAHLDGGPHQPIASSSVWPVDIIDLDRPSTMWYHPHIHDHTFEQVQMGLSGIIISEDPNDPVAPTLPHTYGADDIPIILGDQKFIPYDTVDGVVQYKVDTTKVKRPVNLVNGVTNPYLDVPNSYVRLRILNGSTRKSVVFGLSPSYSDTTIASMKDFIHIATDGGYTINPAPRKSLMLGPGARAEILIDLTQLMPGAVLYLRNLKYLMPVDIVGSPETGLNGSGNGGDATFGDAFLELRVVPTSTFPDLTPINTYTPFTGEWEPGLEDTIGIDRHRTKELVKVPKVGYTINGTSYALTTINDTICVGAKEVWTIHNISNVSHPFHIHKIFFRVLDVTDSLGNQLDLQELGIYGPKDDVLVRPGWKLRFMAKFDDFPNPIDYKQSYMYHCHILTHEDSGGGGMMKQFVVTDDLQCLVSSAKDELSEQEMRLYPNPARTELYLEGRADKESRVYILDLSGRRLRSQRLPAFEGSVPISISGLPVGMYVVYWQTERGFISKKLVLR